MTGWHWQKLAENHYLEYVSSGLLVGVERAGRQEKQMLAFALERVQTEELQFSKMKTNYPPFTQPQKDPCAQARTCSMDIWALVIVCFQ